MLFEVDVAQVPGHIQDGPGVAAFARDLDGPVRLEQGLLAPGASLTAVVLHAQLAEQHAGQEAVEDGVPGSREAGTASR